MIPSRYNLVTRMNDDSYAVFNPLSGAFDIVNGSVAKAFSEKRIPDIGMELLLERGYYFASKEEEEEYIRERYRDFQNESANNKTQFIFIPSYSCNFHCPYCYQKGVTETGNPVSPEILVSFVDFIKKYRSLNGKEVVVTLFGGEPLLPGNGRKETVRALIGLLNAEKIGLSVVTNGYYFGDYADLLKTATVEEIHFTLDGDESVHNKRRFEKEGTDSFNRVMNAMKEAVDSGFPVNLRIITDRVTMETFPSLADKLDALGFLDLPKERFKTSLGRNYELINDYIKPEELFTLDQMVEAYTSKMLEYPLLKKMHFPSFFGITQMIENGEMYLPSFDTCPGAKSEYVFDATGNIYSCTASCGRDGYAIGTYYPSMKFDNAKMKQWKDRSILTIPECRECEVGVVCGGGCAVIAKEKNGSVLSPNCKPVKEIMDIGIRHFSDVLLNLR